MDKILPAIRSMLIDHLAANQPLSANVAVGDTVLHVQNTSHFRPGDEVFLMSLTTNLAEPVTITKINDWDELIIDPPASNVWTMANSSMVQKCIGWIPLKRVHIGDLRQNPDFPMVTIEPTSESNDWITLQATTHEHRLAIRVYVQQDNFETTNILLAKYAKQVREILIDHIHPLVDYVQYALLSDLLVGQTVATISSTSLFQPNTVVFLRDAKPRPNAQEDLVKAILGPTQIELATPAKYDYLTARQAQLFLVNRYFYDTRVSDITYGFVPGQGGSLLKGAELSWYAKEELLRQGNIIT